MSEHFPGKAPTGPVHYPGKAPEPDSVPTKNEIPTPTPKQTPKKPMRAAPWT